MKKVLILIMAAVVCLSISSCKQKNTKANDGDQAVVEQAQAEPEGEAGDEAATAAEDITADLGQYYMVCPFCLQDRGQTDADGNPVTETRKWICGSSVGSSTIADWVIFTQDPRFNFNVDGWHFVGEDIVNADETYKINAEDAVMPMSSFCTIRTEKYVKPEVVAPYHHIVRHSLYKLLDDARRPDILTLGNRHQYSPDAPESTLNLNDAGESVQCSFFLQEWVTVILPADTDYILAVAPYQRSYDDVTFDDDKLAEAVWSGKAEADENGKTRTATFYVSEEEPVGFYDLLLISDGKAQCRLTMTMTKE